MKYIVDVPITALATVEVEAESERKALQKAVENVSLSDLTEWCSHDKILQEGDFYGVINEAEVNKQEEENGQERTTQFDQTSVSGRSSLCRRWLLGRMQSIR